MVCLGNICRSPLAEGILTNKTIDKNVFVDSAGTASYHIGNPPDPRSIDIGKKYNIDISNQRARQFTTSDFDKFDNVPDPYYGGKNGFQDVYNMLDEACEKISLKFWKKVDYI